MNTDVTLVLFIAMDLACGEYGDVVPGLVSAIENGRLIYEETLSPTFATPSLSHGNADEYYISFFALSFDPKMF